MGIIFAQNLICSSGCFLGFGLLMRKNFIQQITQGPVHRKLFSWLILRWTRRRSLTMGPPAWRQMSQLVGCLDNYVWSWHLSPCCTASTWQKSGVAAALWNTGIFVWLVCFFPQSLAESRSCLCMCRYTIASCSLHNLFIFQRAARTDSLSLGSCLNRASSLWSCWFQ